MPLLSLGHLADHVITQKMKAVIAAERHMTAEGLSWLAEFDPRKLYLPAGYPAMYPYCLAELHLSEGRARKRIQVARAARKYPALIDVIADGRVHLSGVVMVTPHLTPENADELLQLATHKTKAEIERLLEQRFRQPDLLSMAASEPLLPAIAKEQADQRTPGYVGVTVQPVEPDVPSAPQHAPAHVEPPAVKLTLRGKSLELFRRAQALLGDEVRSGHPDDIARKVLELAVAALEKRALAIAKRTKPTRSVPRAATSRRRSAARSGSAMAPSALTPATPAYAARHAQAWNLITSFLWPAAAKRQSRTCESSAARTTSTKPSAHSAPDSWPRSAMKRSREPAH